MKSIFANKLTNFTEQKFEIDENITFGSIFDSLGKECFGVTIFFLSLPSAIPLPVNILSGPLGILIAFLGLQMMFLRSVPWMPKKIYDKEIKPVYVKKLFTKFLWFLGKIEFIIYPRFNYIINTILTGFVIMLLAIIMALPFPLTNAIPAIILMLIAISIIERDGLLWILSMIIGIIAIFLYTYGFYMIFLHGPKFLLSIMPESVYRFFGFET